MNQRIFFDSLLWITNVWNQSWIISSPTFVPPFDDEPATQRHFPSEAVFFMSMTGQLLDAKLFFVSMILWCRVSQLACKHWQVWPPSRRSCAHPESDSDWCERCVKCLLYTIWLQLCTYALMSSIHWFNCTEGSLRWKISKGLKKEDECSCPGIWKTFSLLSHTHTKICRDYFQVWS